MFSNFSKVFWKLSLTVPLQGLLTTPEILQDATSQNEEGPGPDHTQAGPRNLSSTHPQVYL